jgi:threonine synthase
MKYVVFCNQCQRPYQNQWWSCPTCGGSLEVKYFPTSSGARFPIKKNLRNILGEAMTPLIYLPELSKELDCQLWAKCESQNPTGSFKDRGSVIEVTKALELKNWSFVPLQYGCQFGRLPLGLDKTKVVVPTLTPESKLQQATAYGASLVKVTGTYDECIEVARSGERQLISLR